MRPRSSQPAKASASTKPLPASGLSRRKFLLTSGAATTAFTIVPRHVLGGPGFVAPSEKLTVAYIGYGTQGLREMLPMLALADMGHYSLWPVFRLFDLDAPVMVESRPSHLCTLTGQVAVKIKNDYSFPAACTVRFKFAAKGTRTALDIFWYDGSMKPPTPEELDRDNKELAEEGMMFIGDKGKILAGFRGEDPQIIPEEKMRDYRGPKPTPPARQGARGQARRDALGPWVAACKGGPPTYGDFRLAEPISDAFNLAAVSLRLGGRRLLFEAANAKVTNMPEGNHSLVREYRKGWELPG